jgi:hypothetical protein
MLCPCLTSKNWVGSVVDIWRRKIRSKWKWQWTWKDALIWIAEIKVWEEGAEAAVGRTSSKCVIAAYLLSIPSMSRSLSTSLLYKYSYRIEIINTCHRSVSTKSRQLLARSCYCSPHSRIMVAQRQLIKSKRAQILETICDHRYAEKYA